MDNRLPRVLLVNTNVEKGPYPVPPLGLCLLATSLESSCVVKVYDGVFAEGSGLDTLVREFSPDFVGFSIRNIDDVVQDRHIFYPDGIMEKFINPVKALTDVPVIIGGSGFSIFPEEMMAWTGADYGIAGEAESLLPVLIAALAQGRKPDGIPGLYTREGLTTDPLSGASFPERAGSMFSEIDRWIDFNPYRPRGVYSIQTKRGCSHGCIYCTYPVIEGRKFRTRRPEEIAEEIEQAHKRLGYITFEFVDSTFNDPAGHAEDICREIIKKKIRVRLRTMGINPRHSSSELFRLMMEAGFAQIDATPDSASPRLLKNLDKGFTRADIEKMALLIREANIPTMWFFLFGGPGEDEETFAESIDFIDRFINPDDLVYMNSGLRIYPNTPLQRIAVEEGRISSSQSLFHPPAYYFSGAVTKEKIDEMIMQATVTRFNCLSSTATAPPPAMIAEAAELRKTNQLEEPMFRTLLRIRKQWKKEGKI